MSGNASTTGEGDAGIQENPRFPDLPEDCPPADAEHVNAIYYCCHSQNPPGVNDFLTAAESGSFLDRPECRRRSNSILRDLSDAREMAKRTPRRFISAGQIERIHGKVLSTPSRRAGQSHCSLWRYEGVRMHDIFMQRVT